MRTLALLCSVLILTGCATVKYSDLGGHAMVRVTNSGWYLLNCIPLASGNPFVPNTAGCRFFQRTTTLENNMRMLDYAVAERGAVGIQDLSTYTTDESLFVLLFNRHLIHTSAELIMPDASATTAP